MVHWLQVYVTHPHISLDLGGSPVFKFKTMLFLVNDKGK